MLITGIEGFTGSHLSELLLENGCEVYGGILKGSDLGKIQASKNRLKLEEFDIRNKDEVFNLIRNIKPDYIYHLAAVTSIGKTWKSSLMAHEVNIVGTVNLFEACKSLDLNPKLHLPCSSAEYGSVPLDRQPVKESESLKPVNSYGISKMIQFLIGKQYCNSFKLPVFFTRTFNVCGPREGDNTVCSSIARQIVEIENKGGKGILYTGNLETKRDYIDIRDAVRAYYLVVHRGCPGKVYNVCSGKSVKISEILRILLSLSKANIQVRQKKSKVRQFDLPDLRGDKSLIKKEIGWEPEVPLETSLKDLLAYWRSKLARRQKSEKFCKK